MQQTLKFDVIILGGGLAGLVCAIELGVACNVLLLEKESYPQHKVCGEYVSNEVLPYLQKLGVDPITLGATHITELEITTHQGKLITTTLPLGGFGISRFTLDQALFEKAKQQATVLQEYVTDVAYDAGVFSVQTKSNTTYVAPYVVGAFGKRSNLDKLLQREFIQQKSPWLAVKAHYNYDFPKHKVALHNFEGGYCGLSQTETGAVNTCYLATYESFKKTEGIDEFQNTVLSKNPHLRHFFNTAIPLFDAHLSISQISFQQKKAVEEHIFMIGDSAGLIHPLCGNGMAMAIHSAKLFSEVFKVHVQDNSSRASLEAAYLQAWQHNFTARLRMGRQIQRILLQPTWAKGAFRMAKVLPGLVPFLIKKTHGDVLV